jgi:hypothetical protein
MKLFLELWKPKQPWLEMDESERRSYVESIAPHIEELMEAGVELVGMGTNDEDTDQRADFRFWAVWRMPEDLVERFETTVREDGFYRYFEQINARGEPRPPEELLRQMAAGA